MQVKTNRDELYRVLSIVSRAVGKSPAVLSGILAQAEDDKITFTANNLDIEITGSCHADIESTGEAVLPAKITEIIKNAPDRDVTIAYDTVAQINSGKAKYTLQCEGAEEFPKPEEQEPDVRTQLFNFESLVKRVAFVSTKDAFEGFKSGVLIDLNVNEITMTATDTYRLAEVTAEAEGEGRYLVPAKNLRTIASIFGDSEVVIDFTSNQMVVRGEHFTAKSRLLEDRFPDLSSVWPKESKTTVDVDVQELINAINRASVVLDALGHIEVLNDEGNLIINAQSPSGSAVESLPVSVKGEQCSALWNPQFLVEGLKAGGKEIHFNGEHGPLVMTAEGYRYLVLPIKRDQ